MTKKPRSGAAFHIGKNANVHLENVRIEGWDTPISIEPGGRLTTKNVTYTKGNLGRRGGGTSTDTKNRNSVGWSGHEQFDPKQSALETDPFYGPRLLLTEGAQKHTAKIEELSAEFFANKPYTAVTDIDRETGEKLFKLKATASPPGKLRYEAHAAVNALRNALDQAVCAAATLVNGKAALNAYFPFAETPADLEGMLSSKRYADIPNELKPFLRSLQPYPTSSSHEGGNDILRALGKTANPNKHQAPLAIGARNLEGVYSVRIHEAVDLIELGAPWWDSSKREFLIARTGPNGTFEYEFQMPFYIAFGEAGRLTDHPLTAVLGELVSVVGGIVSGLEAEVARITAAK